MSRQSLSEAQVCMHHLCSLVSDAQKAWEQAASSHRHSSPRRQQLAVPGVQQSGAPLQSLRGIRVESQVAEPRCSVKKRIQTELEGQLVSLQPSIVQ
jgi:hypothetical protein